MTATIGNLSLYLALLLALWGILAPIWGARSGRQIRFTTTRMAILGQFALVTIASLSLVYALVTTDFSIKYVAFNTTRASAILWR